VVISSTRRCSTSDGGDGRGHDIMFINVAWNRGN